MIPYLSHNYIIYIFHFYKILSLSLIKLTQKNLMILGLLGNKVGMTHSFDSSGGIIPVTIIKVGPCFITQIKTNETDGYIALHLGYREVTGKYSTKPQCAY